MTAPDLQLLAQLFTARMLNTAAEGMVLACLAWAMLRLLGPQNSRTRFAIWFAALLTIGALPFIAGSGIAVAHSPRILSGHLHREIVLSASWAFYLFAAWAAGATLLLLRLGIGLWQVHRLRSHCREVDLDSLEPATAEIFRDFRRTKVARTGTRLCVSQHVNVPAAIGFFRPAIVFPAWLLPQLSPDEVEIILLHENAHLCRWDQWTNLAQKLVKALFFFHPAVWWIESHLTLEREMACDDIVLAHSQSPKAYASFLVSFAEKLHHARSLGLAQALVSRMRQMSRRVTKILDAKRSRSTRLWVPVLAVNAALVAIVVAVAPYQPQFIAFRNQPGQNRAARIQAASQEARTADVAATTASFTVAQPISQGLNAAPQPRVIPAVYHPRKAVLPLRLKAATPAKPTVIPAVIRTVIRTKAEPESLPSQETFVVFQTTEYDSSGSGVWTLCIWRVEGGKVAAKQYASVVTPKI